MKKNEKGFGTVEGILIVVVLVLLGVIGFMVYRNHNKAKDSATVTSTTPIASTNTKPAASTTPETKKYLTISQFGVKFVAPESLGKLEYVIDGDYVRFSNDVDFGCIRKTGSLGTLFKDKASTYAMLGGTVDQPIAHIGEYYYYYGNIQSTCSNDSTTSNKQVEQGAELKTALTTLIAS